MKSINLAIAATLLAISVSSVQADTGTPSILSSVSADSVQTLNKADASKTRGEYRQCFGSTCFYIHTPFGLSTYNNGWSSRKYVGSYTKRIGWGWFSKRVRIYVAR
jgi:hypothetical protein